jgi:UDP-N-acetylmuramoyl-L-alanyl-D-glutamate--2,6-diaminopimelate ligase
MKELIKKLIPDEFLSAYHKNLARLSSRLYGNPSEKMIVIGVTGTNGKSSTVSYISQLLTSLDKKTGFSTTSEIKIDNRTWLNKKKMTMQGRGALQKMLKNMVECGTEYAIIETSSEGIAQSRHEGINYDVAVFTNLTPEHIESHGSFENYKKAKQQFFTYTAHALKKNIAGKKIKKIAIINIDDEHGKDFLDSQFDNTTLYTMSGNSAPGNQNVIAVTEEATSMKGSSFIINDIPFTTPLFGNFTLYNVLAALSVVQTLGYSLEALIEPVKKLAPVPGRLEIIYEGQPFSVVVDFAYEPAALLAVYDVLELMQYGRLIHLLGAAGGGRDTSKRPVLGSMAGKKADIVIVTNEDPYDEAPDKIIDEVARGVRSVGKTDSHDLFTILSRKEAIAKAFSLAKPGDLVLLTGKGCEQVMAVAKGKKIPWDDRIIARELLLKIVDKV